jgi:hypothetical protein
MIAFIMIHNAGATSLSNKNNLHPYHDIRKRSYING